MSLSANIVRPLVFVVLIGALASALVQLGQVIFPGWNGSYLIVMCVLAALEGLYSPRLIKAQNARGSDVLKFHAIELIGLLALLKLVGALGSPSRLLAEFLTVDLKTMGGAFLLFLFWVSGIDTGNDFAELDAPPAPIADQNYVPPAQLLRQRFFVGGLVLLAVAGLLNWQAQSIAGLVPNVLIYFLAGLILLAEIRLGAASREWRALGLIPSRDLVSPWLRSAAILIGLAALIAFVLPTQYMLGLLDWLRDLITVLVSALLFLTSLLGWLITLPFRLLLGQPAGQPTPLPPPPLPPPTPPGTPADNGLLALLPKLILLAVVAYIVYSYLRDNPEAWALLKRLQIVRMLRQFWAALYRRVSGFEVAVRAQLPRTLPDWLRRRLRSAPAPFRFIRLSALSPRGRILYFYLSTLRRAGDRGIPRKPDQTPYEYEDVLDTHLPNAEDEVAALTEAFVEVRYSPHSIDAERARSVQAHWQRLRQAIQQIKRQNDEAEGHD